MPATWKSRSSTATSELSLAGAPLEVRVDPRARRLRLRLARKDARLVLTVPTGVSRRRALAWAGQHEEWARSALETRADRIAFVPGAVFPLRGEMVTIRSAPELRRGVVHDGTELRIGGPAETLAPRLTRWLRAEALRVLEMETREIAATAGRPVAAVSIGDPVSRWGSCASSGRIRYSWRLILAPDFVRRATVAHEVAHLVHMNHGSDFHALVAALFGENPRPARLWLRRHGAGLHRIG